MKIKLCSKICSKKCPLNKLAPNVRGIVRRLIVFLVFYVGISLVHPIFTEWAYGYIFTVQDKYIPYFIFPILLILGYLKWDTIKTIPKYKNNWLQTLGFGLVSIGLFSISIKPLVLDMGFNMIATYFTPIVLGHIFMFLAIFNLKFVKYLKLELVLVSIVVMSYVLSQILIEHFWFYFSKVILYVINIFLPLFTSDFYINNLNYNVQVADFDVFVGPPCSGVYSLVTFSLLLFISLFFISKKKKIKWVEAFIAWLLGMILVFGLNILRVIVIVLVGAYYSEKVALELFHEYLSSIFLLTIFLVYLYFIIPKITKRR
jgi:exosortase/archaeosortase family protein